MRRSTSLQKTKQSQLPKALFNTEDFIKNNFVSGDIVEIEVESKTVYSFVCDKDANGAEGTVAIACGHPNSTNVSGFISSLSLKNQS